MTFFVVDEKHTYTQKNYRRNQRAECCAKLVYKRTSAKLSFNGCNFLYSILHFFSYGMYKMSLRLVIMSHVATVIKFVAILHFFVFVVEITGQSFLDSHF